MVSAVPRLRRIVMALLHAVSGGGSHNSTVGVCVLVVFGDYDKILGQNFPEWFGILSDPM